MLIPDSSTNSIPKQGHRWKCVPGFRASLGFDETPQSPETIRGGDTSLFSLPSESAADTTPHTSNVSLTTTITSAFSPEKRHLGYSLERVNIRRALNTVSNLFDSLSIACGKLAEVMAAKSDNSVEASAEIKCIHLQLMKLSVEDLKALIDSFELDLLPLQITRPVSQDHGEGADNNMNSSFLSQPQPLARSGYIHSTAQELVQQTMNIPIEPLGVNVVEQDEEDGINLFSPSTEDMNSIEQSTINTADHLNTADDLRRTVGSFDLEDVVEERDPPPRVRQRAERKAGMRGRGIWKRLGSRRFRRVAE